MKRKQPTLYCATVFGAAAVGLVLSGCSSSSPQENVSQACSAAEDFTAAVSEFSNALTPDATVDQLRAARDKVNESYDTLVSETQDVAQDRMVDLDSKVRDLRSALNSVPDDTKVPAALDSLRTEASDVGTAVESLESELTC